MTNRPVFDAILLDVDGTLYEQRPVRRRMLLRLLAAAIHSPLKTRREISVLRAFRSSLEEIRIQPRTAGKNDAERQIELTVERTGLSQPLIREIVEDWMFQRPLALLGGYPVKGLHPFLRRAIQEGVAIGAFSEYPCDAKLEALGVRDCFQITVSSWDADIGRFKPDPRGFLAAAQQLGCTPERTLMIGDREDADGAGARAAGMPFINIGSQPFHSFVPLCKHLFGSTEL
jgi:HAD superfamily hydrolase (TIGR01509 family)